MATKTGNVIVAKTPDGTYDIFRGTGVIDWFLISLVTTRAHAGLAARERLAQGRTIWSPDHRDEPAHLEAV